MITAKVQARAVSPPKEAKPQTAVVDIAEALKKSLANLKKPPTSGQAIDIVPGSSAASAKKQVVRKGTASH